MSTEFQKIRDVIGEIFSAAREKDFERLAELIRYDDITKFGDLPPLERKEGDAARYYDFTLFTNITDFSCVVESLKVQLFHDFAVATFYVRYGGILVNDYAFEAQRISVVSRATFVLARMEGRWTVVHEHLSKMGEGDSPLFEA
jgi:ketosteroid isomerase-like protein